MTWLPFRSVLALSLLMAPAVFTSNGEDIQHSSEESHLELDPEQIHSRDRLIQQQILPPPPYPAMPWPPSPNPKSPPPDSGGMNMAVIGGVVAGVGGVMAIAAIGFTVHLFYASQKSNEASSKPSGGGGLSDREVANFSNLAFEVEPPTAAEGHPDAALPSAPAVIRAANGHVRSPDQVHPPSTSGLRTGTPQHIGGGGASVASHSAPLAKRQDLTGGSLHSLTKTPATYLGHASNAASYHNSILSPPDPSQRQMWDPLHQQDPSTSQEDHNGSTLQEYADPETGVYKTNVFGGAIRSIPNESLRPPSVEDQTEEEALPDQRVRGVSQNGACYQTGAAKHPECQESWELGEVVLTRSIEESKILPSSHLSKSDRCSRELPPLPAGHSTSSSGAINEKWRIGRPAGGGVSGPDSIDNVGMGTGITDLVQRPRSAQGSVESPFLNKSRVRGSGAGTLVPGAGAATPVHGSLTPALSSVNRPEIGFRRESAPGTPPLPSIRQGGSPPHLASAASEEIAKRGSSNKSGPAHLVSATSEERFYHAPYKDREVIVSGSMRWTKGELLGQGSFGKVWAGLNQSTGELMAVKILNMSHKRSQLSEVQLELDMCKSLSHDNIVGYICSHLDLTTDRLYIFLEHCAGGSIASMLKRFGKFSEDVTRSYTRQVLEGLDYLHSHGVIHRDLKGGNILIAKDGAAKISDFGASKYCSENTASDSVHIQSMAGTVYWIAPEVIKGTGYGRKADVWSLGCLVIEMLTGRHPWQELREMSHNLGVMFAIAKSDTGPTRPQDCGAEVLSFLDDCLRIEPIERLGAHELLSHPWLCRGRPSGPSFPGELVSSKNPEIDL